MLLSGTSLLEGITLSRPPLESPTQILHLKNFLTDTLIMSAESIALGLALAVCYQLDQSQFESKRCKVFLGLYNLEASIPGCTEVLIGFFNRLTRFVLTTT
jgi:hypothetical protein